MNPPLAAVRVEAALSPCPRNLRNPSYCLLCGFLLANDLDGHFVQCLLRRSAWIWFERIKPP